MVVTRSQRLPLMDDNMIDANQVLTAGCHEAGPKITELLPVEEAKEG